MQAAFGVAAFSCVLMPDHLHLVVMPGLRERLRRVLAAFTARSGIRFDVLEPEVANSVKTAGRMMRYGFYNPVRAGFVDDPWRWPFSTLRDLGGAVHPAWTPISTISAFLGLSPATALRTLTTVANRCAKAPIVARVELASVSAIRGAVASALRVPIAEAIDRPLGRRLAIQAADAIAGPTARRLATELGCSERTIHRLRHPRHSALDAVLLCLGDDRLRWREV
jgi:hypothetical protein